MFGIHGQLIIVFYIKRKICHCSNFLFIFGAIGREKKKLKIWINHHERQIKKISLIINKLGANMFK
jgi:hypothetical protein